MLLKTSKGHAYEVDWIDTVSTGALFMQMPDERALSVIAAEFEGLEWLKREDANQGDKRFEGYCVLTMAKRPVPGIVILTFGRGDAQ